MFLSHLTKPDAHKTRTLYLDHLMEPSHAILHGWKSTQDQFLVCRYSCTVTFHTLYLKKKTRHSFTAWILVPEENNKKQQMRIVPSIFQSWVHKSEISMSHGSEEILLYGPNPAVMSPSHKRAQSPSSEGTRIFGTSEKMSLDLMILCFLPIS